MSNVWNNWGVLLQDAGENVLYEFDMAFDSAWNDVQFAGDVYNDWTYGRKYWDEYNRYLSMPLCEVFDDFNGYRPFEVACYDFVDGE